MLWQNCVFTESTIAVNTDKKDTALKLPPPTLSQTGRTWLRAQLEMGADLLLPLTAFFFFLFCLVFHTHKEPTHCLFLLVAPVIVASLNMT